MTYEELLPLFTWKQAGLKKWGPASLADSLSCENTHWENVPDQLRQFLTAFRHKTFDARLGMCKRFYDDVTSKRSVRTRPLPSSDDKHVEIMGALERVSGRLDKLEERMGKIESQMTSIAADVSDIKADVSDIRDLV